MIRDYKTPRWKAGGLRRREKFPRLARLLTILGVLLLVGGATATAWEGYRRILRLSYFRVVEVEVEGNLQVASRDITASLGLSPDASILEVDLPALTRRVLQNPWIKEASIRRRLPLSLTIQIVERKPEAVFIADRRYLLSADGVILARLEPDELPTLPTLRAAGQRRVAIGEQILTSEMAQGLSVWRQFQVANALKGERAHEIAITGDGSYVVNLGERMPTIRLRAEDMEGQFRRLGAALATGGQALERFAEVDLRFRDRVIFTPGRAGAARPQG